MTNNTKIYDEQIAPLFDQIKDICEPHNIDFLFGFVTDSGEDSMELIHSHSLGERAHILHIAAMIMECENIEQIFFKLAAYKLAMIAHTIESDVATKH